jgi:hypothetical protein
VAIVFDSPDGRHKRISLRENYSPGSMKGILNSVAPVCAPMSAVETCSRIAAERTFAYQVAEALLTRSAIVSRLSTGEIRRDDKISITYSKFPCSKYSLTASS